MSLPTHYLFHLLNETKKHFTPQAAAAGEHASSAIPAGPTCGILCFSTSWFDEMMKFFSAMGFDVAEGRDQLLPIFSEGRGARVKRGDFEFNLEESTRKRRATSSGYNFTYAQSLYVEFYTFTSPDGGTFVIH